MPGRIVADVLLKAQRCPKLPKREKGTVWQYLALVTGYSPARRTLRQFAGVRRTPDQPRDLSPGSVPNPDVQPFSARQSSLCSANDTLTRPCAPPGCTHAAPAVVGGRCSRRA